MLPSPFQVQLQYSQGPNLGVRMTVWGRVCVGHLGYRLADIYKEALMLLLSLKSRHFSFIIFRIQVVTFGEMRPVHVLNKLPKFLQLPNSS